MRKFLAVSTLFLISCQSAKDAFTLKKKPSGDEFLVEKKVPCFASRIWKIPLPQEEQFDKLNSDEDIKNIISDNKTSYIYRKIQMRHQ